MLVYYFAGGDCCVSVYRGGGRERLRMTNIINTYIYVTLVILFLE